MASDPMTPERVDWIDRELGSRYTEVELLCTALREAWRERDKALNGIKQLAESNRKLRADLRDHEKVVTYD